MNNFVMTRKGFFTPSSQTAHQCKQNKTFLYNYECKVVFNSSQLLDNNGFVIAHEDIDEAIQKLKLQGSCEEMAKDIVTTVKALIVRKLGGITGIKVTIFPQPEGQAHISYIFIDKASNLPLLNV